MLLLVWLALMSFGGISVLNPAWLQELSQPGVDTEALNYKMFADNHLRQGNVQLAIRQYQYALDIKPDLTGAMVNLAIAFGQVGDIERGIQALEAALEKESVSRGVIYLNLGDLQAKKGDEVAALRAYQSGIEAQRALSAGAEVYPMYEKLGMLFLRRGELDKAREAFVAALENKVDPQVPYQEMLCKSLSRYRDNPEVLRSVQKQLALGPEEMDLSAYDLEFIRYLQGHDPETFRIYAMLGRIDARLGNLDTAARFLERALQIQPGNEIRNELQEIRRRLEASGADTSK